MLQVSWRNLLSPVMDRTVAADKAPPLRESGSGPERRKALSAPMSAIGVLSGLVLLTRSFVDPKPT
jgi:hypothetical protein